MNKLEVVTNLLLERCSLLDVVGSQISYFTEKHGHAPLMCVVTLRCKSAFTVELMQALGLPARDALMEPFILNTTSVVFRNIGTDYVITRSSQATEVL